MGRLFLVIFWMYLLMRQYEKMGARGLYKNNNNNNLSVKGRTYRKGLTTTLSYDFAMIYVEKIIAQY